MIGSITNKLTGSDAPTTSARPAGTRFSDAFQAATAEDTTSTALFATRHTATVEPDDSPENARLKEAVAAFKKELSLTPAERVRRDVLKNMDLTEEAIEALPAEKRVEVEQKVAMEVARRMKVMRGGEAGLTTAPATLP